MKPIPVAFALCALMTSYSALAAVAETRGEIVDPLLPGDKGAWRSMGVQHPTVSYEALVRPKMRLSFLELKCETGWRLEARVMGMVPRQQFPQPEMEFTVGSTSKKVAPAPFYVAMSKPDVTILPKSMKFDKKLDELNRTHRLEYPGYPAHAILLMTLRMPEIFPALANEQEIIVKFAGQERRFPAIPSDMRKQFVERCSNMGRVTPMQRSPN